MWDGGQGSAYRGSATFTTLQGVVNGIASTGGWAQLPNTTLSTVFPTAAQIDAIAPVSVLRQPQWPNNVTIWGSAAFNGFGWFYTTPGGHFAGYTNDTYLVRLADPVAVVRMHMPAPLAAVARRDTGVIVARGDWAGLSVSNVNSYTEWGPRGCHQYSGAIWLPSLQKMVFGGDAQTYCTNPAAVGSSVQTGTAIYVFDPYASTPKSAWARVPAAVGGNSLLGFIDNGDGTVSFRVFGSTQRYTLNVANRTIASGARTPSPMADAYTGWRHVVRDPANGRTYELHETNIGANGTTEALYETTSGSYVKVADLPASWWVNPDEPYRDTQTRIEIVNGRAYICGQIAAGTATTVQLGVHQIDLTTKAVRSFTASPTMTVPEGLYQSKSLNGIHGRFGYVPQAGCFVVMLSARANVWVFRPPAAWAV